MNITEYKEKRVNDQIDWFIRESKFNRYAYYTTKVILTLSAAAMPALTNLNEHSWPKLTIGIVSVMTVFLANINSIFNFKDKWLVYRSAAEFLKSELYQFEAKAGKYKDASSENLFVEAIEKCLNGINSQWKDVINVENDQGR